MTVETRDKLEQGKDNPDNKDFLSRVIDEFIKGESNDETGDRKTRVRPGTSSQHFKRQDVVRALNNIQLTYRPKYVAGRQVNVNTEDFKTAMLNSMAKLENTAIPKTMNQIDGRTVDFVEMIFGAFLRDENISDAVKNLLLRMQIPVIKTSLLDNNFFYNADHPARELLNTIAQLCIGIEDEEHTVYKTIDLILEQLLRSYDENPVSYRTALMSLQRLKTIELEKRDKNEQQIRKQIMQEHARQVVLTELQLHTMNTRIPKTLQPLILNQWSTLMFQRHVKFGKDSDEWREATQLLALLCKTLKPIEALEQWQYVHDIHRATSEKIRKMLEASTQNQDKVGEAINTLENHYDQLLKASQFYTEQADTQDTEITSIDELKQELEATSIETAPEQTISEMEELPDEVKPNAWFEVYVGPDKPIRRLKLSIILDQQSQLIFVDHRGNKIIEKDASEFKQELADEMSRLIADRMIFEHALSQVISSIATRK